MMTNNTVNTPKAPPMMDRLANAAATYAQRANSNGVPGGLPSRMSSAGKPHFGGIGGAAAAVSSKPMAAGAGSYQISSEAARGMLERNHGKLGELMEARLRSQAGPVKQ